MSARTVVFESSHGGPSATAFVSEEQERMIRVYLDEGLRPADAVARGMDLR